MKAIRARASGRVQGVGYRYSARIKARGLGVTGWIENAADGSVVAFAQGDDAAVDWFEEWLRHGPPGGRVEDFEVESVEPDPQVTSFEVR